MGRGMPDGFRSQPNKAARASVFENAISLAKALAFGETVSAEVVEARFRICQDCNKAVIASKGSGGKIQVIQCSVCGCKAGPSDKTLVNMARFVEVNGRNGIGCHYHSGLNLPDRSKWAKAGL